MLVRVTPDHARYNFRIGISKDDRRAVASHFPLHSGAVPIADAHDLLSDAGRTNDQLPQLRVGMAFGQVLTRLGDVYGPTVNLASRLTSLARPGAVLVDKELAQALRGEPRFRLHSRRPASVRGYHHLRSWSLRPAG